MKLPLLFILTIIGIKLSAAALEYDDAANQSIRARPLFNKADTNNDWKLTAQDGVDPAQLSALDTNKDGVVTYQEYSNNLDIPYEPWNGEVLRNIVYKRKDGRTLLMDIYRKSSTPSTAQPVLYFVHGGGWSGGIKEPNQRMLELFQRATESGFSCVAVNYRLVRNWDLNDPVIMRDCVIDVKDGLRFLKKNAEELRVNPDKVIVIGFSAGGHLAQMLNYTEPTDFKGATTLANYSIKPAGGISWYGPSDFTEDKLFESDDAVHLKFKPGSWQKLVDKTSVPLTYATATPHQKDLLKEVSPTTYIDASDPPMLALHGTIDPVISFHHLEHLKEVANSKGAPIQTIAVENAPHGWYGKNLSPQWPDLLDHMVDFMQRIR
ncbi:alpha/beta hydrolase fold domain-containing protein [Coraliomargarita algicola]|uniref:Alpha/beta hydrolase fold domain-containing protein n=1 Tax=Coraliomargarita algicola TaxID=3092156 RepID=A0ABZ0RK59_9BACT|nr:alpha/beta fold hydrolase [Coraliomargarita sp. J2-16]WPJ95165.1 alpha/beta hydrolase fold domain-containing protein [Coraliomargarita sp. J2-16]